MAEAIILENISFSYPKGGFTLTCPKLCFETGRIALITGKNGSGKTTLSKLMCGILRPDSGNVMIFSELANDMSLGAIGKHVGYLFQEPARQLFTPTVWEELTFIDNINGVDSEQTAIRADELLKRFNMQDLKHRNTYKLSRGEKQRLALCAILMQGTKFLILDESTTGLDKQNRQTLYSIMEELAASGAGFAVITHDNEVINRYPDVRIHVENGAVL